MPAISVIIPCYNCRETIEETLDSLAGDAFRDFEVLLVDDGSTDDTAAVIARYAARSDLRLRCFRQENAGVGAARNRGLDEAQGEYVVFLDADDLFSVGYPARIERIMRAHGCDTMASCRSRERGRLAADTASVPATESDPAKLLEEYTYSKDRLGFTTFVYRRDILNAHGIRFTPGLKYGEDIEFLTRYLAHCKTAVFLPCVCYYYRTHGGSATQTVNPRMSDLIVSSMRAASYLRQMGHPFAERFGVYMPYRAVFAVAHRFARGQQRTLYRDLIRDYPVRDAMRFISTDYASDLKSRAAAWSYRLSPALYYRICKHH